MNYTQFKKIQEFTQTIVSQFDNINLLTRSIFDSYNRVSAFINALSYKVEATNVLEIGTFGGVTTAFLALNYPKVTTFDIVDVFSLEKEHIWKKFNLTDRIVPFIGNNLFKKEQISKLGPFDLAFIDGDHSYEGVKFDYDCLKGNLTEDAVLIFDDVQNSTLGVDKFISKTFPKSTILSLERHIAVIKH